jgi:peptidyl-prolyl cis-trans isomerase A (cyclophilin A)
MQTILIRIALTLAAALTAAGAGAQQTAGQPQGDVVVRIETPLGSIDLVVDTTDAPITAANFPKSVDNHLDDGGRFHRATRPDNYTPALPNRPPMEIVQAGINPAKRSEGFGPIPLERTSVTGLKHRVGTVSMARAAQADTATSDFFICATDLPYLDAHPGEPGDNQGFAAFGHVVEGMAVVHKILGLHTSKTAPVPAMKGQMLDPPVPIVSAKRA